MSASGGQPPRRTKKLSLLTFQSRRDGPSRDGDAPSLDEEMEKVFAMASDDKFNLALLSPAAPTAPTGPTGRASPEQRRFLEDDSYRRKSYQHTHSPLKPLRPMRRRPDPSSTSSSPPASEDVSESPRDRDHSPDSSQATRTPRDGDGSLDNSRASEDLPSFSVSGPPPYDDDDYEDDEYEQERRDSVSEALLSERAHQDSSLYGSPDALRRVQFHVAGGGGQQPPGDAAAQGQEVGLGATGTPTPSQEPVGPVSMSPQDERRSKRMQKPRHHHHHHHHHRFRKYSLQEDPESRKHSGAEFPAPDPDERRRASVHPEEAATLQEIDLEQLASRRFDDAKGPRRLKALPKMASLLPSGDVLPPGAPMGTYKKSFDRSPHEVFVQLDELCGEGEDREWKETARWIKYEEHVEEGADRWGRPHVASLSFHSLLNLRRCLETGVVLLDLEERDLPGVAYRIVEQMVIEDLILPEDKPTVMRALLLRHRHVNEHERFRFGMKKSSVSYSSLQNLSEDKRPSIVPSRGSIQSTSLFPRDRSNSAANNHLDSQTKDNHVVDMKEEMTYSSSTEDVNRKGTNDSILKRIPVGAEAITVLVGAVDFLDQPTIAFVRLAEGIVMPSITEVTIPVRFIFILLGPRTTDLDYHEIGRSISTLMANKQFHQIAYKAEDRKELLSAINDFLDGSIVLPPGDWERQDLLPFEEIKAKSEAIRRRKTNHFLETDEAQKALLELAAKKALRPDPLRRTKRPWGGLFNDLKRRVPYYLSDLTDGLNLQTFAAAIFMYFASLSASITFGGLMADKTQNMIGISETLVATSLTGIIFALIAGQPLVIVGATGPLLLFDESLYNMCASYGIEYLTLRVYVGMWLFVIAVLVSCVEGSVFVKVFTRFTEELFATLICLIYIVESVMKLFKVYQIHPLMSLVDYCEDSGLFIPIERNGTAVNETEFNTTSEPSTSIADLLSSDSNITTMSLPTLRPIVDAPIRNQPNTALFCTMVALGTFFIAYYLRHFRNSKFLGRSARRALGDFGVPIAIVVMVALDFLVPGVYTEKLKVPEGLSPSDPAIRGWIISPVGKDSPIPWWVAIACFVPALLVYILLFMETHIAELIIDKEERKLKKGSGFHLDIVVICLLNMGCGIMGAPWICAATVRSVAHVSAVTVMSRTHAPGDKPHIIEVKEQRVSALLVAILVGLSVLMSPLLRLVPMAVLFGVFLYMGISSIAGIQFFDRLKLFFMPVKHHTSVAYVRKVPTMKMHLFTLIQLICLIVLWVVKSSQISLAFPFFLLLMIPLRSQLPRIFSPVELRALDSSKPEDEEDEPDFYIEAPLPG